MKDAATTSTPPPSDAPSSLSGDELDEQLTRIIDADLPSLDLVLAFAGDREPSRAERRRLRRLRRQRGDAFYADMLFVLTHTFIPHEIAAARWHGLLGHRNALSEALGRDPGLAVAALDYFTNVVMEIEMPTVIGHGELASVVELAFADGLTGLFDHRTFMSRLEQELKRQDRYGDGFCVIMFDVDDFKRVNDRHGHLVGDEVLKEVARVVADETRATAVASRYGGEEFAVLEPRATLADAELLAQRILQGVKRTAVDGVSVTMSAGVAACPEHGRTPQHLVASADRALYTSKRDGKNRVTVASARPNDLLA
jgi:diguanylate cyclase (GGDEF)-like protein